MTQTGIELRQGGVLTLESAYDLGLLEKSDLNNRAIIISHDCDLQSSQEGHIEVILASMIKKADPSFCHAKHVRRLHLTYNKETELSVVFELDHDQEKKIHISREKFIQIASLDCSFNFSTEDKRILKQWLAARYGRPAFPDAFENRLRKNKRFEQKLADKLKPCEVYLVGIFFGLGEERSIELLDDTPYYLSVFLVYEGDKGPFAREAAEECALNIQELFYQIFDSPHNAKEIVLEDCFAVADTDFSLKDIRKTDQWRVHHLSLRETPHSNFLPIGETPS